MSKMTSLHSLGLVLVEFEYEYQGRDGNMVSIKPNERYMLLAKTNDHWWHVCKDERAKPFYIPAKYVKELPPNIPSPLDFREPPNPDLRPAVSDLAEVRRPDEVTIRLRPKGNHHKTENRMSTFGVPLDLHEPPSYKCGGPSDSLISLHTAPSSDSSQQKKKSQVTNLLFGSRSAPAETVPDKFRVPSFSPADPLHRPTPAKPVELPVIKNLTETKSDKKSPDPESPIKPESESSSPEPLPSPESENIYESISDLNIDVTALTNTVPAGLPNPQTNISSSPPEIKTENENPTTAVYANVADLKKTGPRSTISSASTCSSPGVTLSPTPDSAFLPDLAGWQVHTDHDSGKEFYYHRATGQSSWSDPRSPHPGASMESVALAAPSPAHSQGSDWEQLLDEATGRHYYYNHTSKQTSWTAPESISPPPSIDRAHSHGQQVDEPPPLPEEDYPTNEHVQSQNPPHLPSDLQLGQIKRPVIPRANIDTYKDVPLGWSRSVEANGKSVFTSEHTHEQWIQSKDDKGKSYYYSKDGSKTQWALPEASIQHGQPALGNGTDQDTQPVLNNWRSTMIQFNPSQEDTQKFSPSHRRVASDYASDASSSGNSPESQLHDKKFRRRRNLSSHSTDSHSHHQSSLEKAGILNKTKIAENGKRLRKNWAQSWTVLHDGILTFHKDPKFTPAGMATKSTQIVPEYTAELKGATILWATKEKSSKKNVLELKTRHGVEFLIQYDTDSIIHDWHKIIQDTIKQLDHGHYSEDEAEETGEKPPLPTEREKKSETARLSSSSSIDTEQGRVRNKLRKFLQRRPTLQSVKEKGYIKDNVFGCHLDTLCHRENTTVPKFMEKCIRSVEKRGLKIDGIYRVSGNLAVIQKLRYKADHEEDLDLEDGQWEEIHVITGALKLFLRELPEPLFPYSFFDRFIAAIKMSDYIQKVSYIRDLVRNLPLPNHDTMEVLFRHLRKVIEHGESNRMSVQSMAIVFGPTLLRPQEESNITIHMVFQNQIVELILNEFNELFQPK